eukprot:COSAG02_NODE_3054_length_7458_cov_5.759750_2_plen_51_part_00
MMPMYCAFRKCKETISKILSDRGSDILGTTEFSDHATLVRRYLSFSVILC